jgi:hypothetical protein
MEHIAGEALRMDAHQGRIAADIAHFEDHGLFHYAVDAAFKAVNPEVSEAARKIGFRDFTQFQGWGHRWGLRVTSL